MYGPLVHILEVLYLESWLTLYSQPSAMIQYEGVRVQGSVLIMSFIINNQWMHYQIENKD